MKSFFPRSSIMVQFLFHEEVPPTGSFLDRFLENSRFPTVPYILANFSCLRRLSWHEFCKNCANRAGAKHGIPGPAKKYRLRPQNRVVDAGSCGSVVPSRAAHMWFGGPPPNTAHVAWTRHREHDHGAVRAGDGRTTGRHR